VTGDGASEVVSSEADLVIVTSLAAPTVTDAARCGPGAVTLSAAGSGNGSYRWYTASTGGLLTGEVNSSFTTPSLTASTTYYVSIVSGPCESPRIGVTATVNPVPATPVIASITRCTNAAVTLTPSGAATGQYLWYDVATGGSAISTSDSFTTPALASTTTYYVSASISGCESIRTAVTITIVSCANNQPPAIITATSGTGISGTATIDLTPLISDPDNNLDMATLRIVVQPKSGATATIDQNGQLRVDYSGSSFAGSDELTIEVCDIAGSCVQQVIRIIVSGEIVVFNAVSPNGDGKNDIFHLAYIDVIEETRANKVTILNRWGDVVFEVGNYNNTTNIFSGNNKNGNQLPSGTYFYRIEFTSGKKAQTGYLLLKR
jgi:gliding motility-associated-like protein